MRSRRTALPSPLISEHNPTIASVISPANGASIPCHRPFHRVCPIPPYPPSRLEARLGPLEAHRFQQARGERNRDNRAGAMGGVSCKRDLAVRFYRLTAAPCSDPIPTWYGGPFARTRHPALSLTALRKLARGSSAPNVTTDWPARRRPHSVPAWPSFADAPVRSTGGQKMRLRPGAGSLPTQLPLEASRHTKKITGLGF
jgi:hypothetical protein